MAERGGGVRTRVMLVAALMVVIATVTGGSLLIVRDRVRQLVERESSAELGRSLANFRSLQQQRRSALLHENALLADLPSLKALLTTEDAGTIADGAQEFWQVSSTDLFAVADRAGQVVTVETRGSAPSSALRARLQLSLNEPRKHYLVADGRVFDFAVQPLYFGSPAQGTVLGYVVSGYAVDSGLLTLLGGATGAQAALLAGDRCISSTLPATEGGVLAAARGRSGAGQGTVRIGGETYLAKAADLSGEATMPLELVILQSLEPARSATERINRLVALLGIAAIVLGSLLMQSLSRVVTRPLELLATGVRAFGTGDRKHALPPGGTKEVRELSEAFARMREEIEATNRALLEAEKLATIGRMANSVSHDLRHYLAAVYANAEFLASSRLTAAEREDLFADVQVAVHGATELMDSLLIFSRSGPARAPTREPTLQIVERAATLVRSHPEAEGVVVEVVCAQPAATDAVVDARKLERAIYNLLLNGCQAARMAGEAAAVRVEVAGSGEQVCMTICDTGGGVPVGVRGRMFEPFVSEGKQSGTGLGLTLAHAIAEEHGGAVTLRSSRPGETVFVLSIERSLPDARGVEPAQSWPRVEIEVDDAGEPGAAAVGPR